MHVVEHGRADEEAVLVAGDHEAAAVDATSRRPAVSPVPIELDDPVAGRGGDDRAHVAAGSRAGADHDAPAARSRPSRPARRPAAPTATAAEIAMQRSPAEPNAAAARWSAAKSRSASGRTTAWFLAPPRACTRLPAAVARLVDVPGDRRGADERDRRDVRVVEQRVDGHLVAVDDVEHAVGQAGLRPQLGEKLDAEGSRSLGLSTKVLPAAIATGCIHIGTMTGKLNGVMPATTPSGWRKEKTSTPVETWSE